MMERPRFENVTARQEAVANYDAGLRAYMLKVYNYMALALVMTGLTAFGVSQSPAMINAIFGTPLQWVVMLAPIGFVFFLSAKIHTMKPATAQVVFWIYAVLMGVSLSSIFLVFTGASVTRVFFISAAAFAGLSLFGYTTKRDLGPIGAALTMALIGLIVASIVNIFLASSGFQFLISLLGVVIFAGMTAYDTQQIKLSYTEALSAEDGERMAIFGALRLYLDFINLFVMLLQLLGNRE